MARDESYILTLTEGELVTIRGALRHHIANINEKRVRFKDNELATKHIAHMSEIIKQLDPYLEDWDERRRNFKSRLGVPEWFGSK